MTIVAFIIVLVLHLLDIVFLTSDDITSYKTMLLTATGFVERNSSESPSLVIPICHELIH